MKKGQISKTAVSLSLSVAIALAGTPMAFAAGNDHIFERTAGVSALRGDTATSTGAKWDFASNLEGWSCTGTYTNAKDQNGKQCTMTTPTASQNFSVSGGVMQLSGVKFLSGDWDEIKLGTSAAGLTLTGCNSFSYDFYYDASVKLTGCFKTKLILSDSNGKNIVEKYLDTDASGATEVQIGNKTYKKVTVVLPIDTLSANNTAVSIGLSIAGWKNNYQGELYLDNIAFTAKTPADAGYVQKTEQTTAQAALNLNGLNIPNTMETADSKATDCTASLLALMHGTSSSGQVLYGHHNDTHNKAGQGASDSDTKDMVNDYPVISGIDGLAFTGSELDLKGKGKAADMARVKKAAEISAEAADHGSVVTLSFHMPNFAQVAAAPRINGNEFNYDDYGYESTKTLTGDVAAQILKGDGNDVQKAFDGCLDMVVEYGKELQAKGVPVLFRPFHENTGGWFWWGTASTTASQFKNLYRYAETYIQSKGVHNFLYVYSPGGPVTNPEEYAKLYPGDDYVDVIGFDEYNTNPDKENVTWLSAFQKSCAQLEQFAVEHGKIPAVTETGILSTNGALPKTGNQCKDWFQKVNQICSATHMAYFMSWANFSESNCSEPYMVDNTYGHEMVNEFIKFYNDTNSIFASQMPNYTNYTNKVPAAQQAVSTVKSYLLNPGSYDYVNAGTKLTAKMVEGNPATVQFVLTGKSGISQTVSAVKDASGDYTAKLTAQDLPALGKGVGSITLKLDDYIADSTSVVFNITKPASDPALVDNFEEYFGDDTLLHAKYSTNVGSGCAVSWNHTTQQHDTGDYGLAFHYTLAPNGWAGIIKNQSADWSGYNALQLWVKPDGKGQKLIIQLGGGSEDYEYDLSTVTKDSDTKARLLTLKFSDFKGKESGKAPTASTLKKLSKVAIYCNTVGNQTVDSTIYFDDLRAINTAGTLNTKVMLNDGTVKSVTPNDVIEIPVFCTYQINFSSQNAIKTFFYNSGNGKVIQTGTAAKWNGTSGVYSIYAHGKVGEKTGIYVNGVMLFSVKIVARPFTSDTTVDFNLRVGQTYIFYVKPNAVPKNYTFITANGKALQTSIVKGSYPDKDGKYYGQLKITKKFNGRIGVYCRVNGASYKIFSVVCK